jgi:hypothetical protein
MNAWDEKLLKLHPKARVEGIVVCLTCCTDKGDRLEVCVDLHQHQPDSPYCPTLDYIYNSFTEGNHRNK